MPSTNLNPNSPNFQLLLQIPLILIPEITLCMEEDRFTNRSEWLRVQIRDILTKRKEKREIEATRPRAKKRK